MKLRDVLVESQKPGTYAGVRFSDRTKQSIVRYCEDNEIADPVHHTKLHSTLLYSRKHCPNYKPHGKYEKAMVGKSTKFHLIRPGEIMTNEGIGDNTNCILVLKYHCPELEQRHHKLMDEHQAQYDFPEFVAHLTLSYNAGEDLAINQLPSFDDPIEIIEEYGEELRPHGFADDVVVEI